MFGRRFCKSHTLTFLNEQEIEHIKEYGPMTSKNVEHLMVVDNDEVVGFMEIENHKLEMLFIASNQRGKGLGKAFTTIWYEEL